MTATVISLDSRRRRNHEDTCDCPRGQLDALASRTRALLDQHEGQLLVPREHLEQALADVLTTTDRLLPPSEGVQP